jgi:hypothetical protein
MELGGEPCTTSYAYYIDVRGACASTAPFPSLLLRRWLFTAVRMSLLFRGVLVHVLVSTAELRLAPYESLRPGSMKLVHPPHVRALPLVLLSGASMYFRSASGHKHSRPVATVNTSRVNDTKAGNCSESRHKTIRCLMLHHVLVVQRPGARLQARHPTAVAVNDA